MLSFFDRYKLTGALFISFRGVIQGLAGFFILISLPGCVKEKHLSDEQREFLARRKGALVLKEMGSGDTISLPLKEKSVEEKKFSGLGLQTTFYREAVLRYSEPDGKSFSLFLKSKEDPARLSIRFEPVPDSTIVALNTDWKKGGVSEVRSYSNDEMALNLSIDKGVIKIRDLVNGKEYERIGR